MDKQLIFWAIVFAAAVILEIATMQLISIWFAVGALAAFIVSFFLPFGYQLAVFVIATGLMLMATRPLLKKLRKPAVPTNHELNLGNAALVIEDIVPSEGTGRVRIKGVDWAAVSEDSTVIKKGESVTVKQIQGAHVIVSLIRKSETARKETADLS